MEVVVLRTVRAAAWDVNWLEERVRAARDEAGRELLVRAWQALEEQALADHRGAVRQRRVERRWDTTLGRVRFRRWRVKREAKTDCRPTAPETWRRTSKS